jgi:hypothetical protein
MYDSSCMKESKKGKGGDEKQRNLGANVRLNDQGVTLR